MISNFKSACKEAFMRYTLFLICLIVFISCSNSNNPNIDVNHQLSRAEQKEFVASMIRYMGRLAPKATHQTKFSSEFDEHYQKEISSYRLEYYHKAGDTGTVYFLATRAAPSLYERRTATAGKIGTNESGYITFYEEKFRTWKMAQDELMQKSELLFTKFIEGGDLTQFYSEHSGGEEYIEFPNEHTFFDREERRWMSTLFDPVEAFQNAGL
jgi:hypothetical protein